MRLVYLFNTFIEYLLNMNAKEYIKYLLSIENYSFSVDEIAKNTDGSSTSLKFELHRLTEKENSTEFVGDLEGLLRPEIKYNQSEAFDWLKNELMEII